MTMPNVKNVLSNRFTLIAALVLLIAGLGWNAFMPRAGSIEAHASEQLSVVGDKNAPSSPLGIRAIGDPNAPVTITEHSSLTCGHCGSFHKTTFKELKEKYIDTGRIYLVFQDFPLNLPALEASMIARCLPEERFFPFIQLLFETQDKWAYDKKYMKYLKQNAQLAGLSGDQLSACLDNKELQAHIISGMAQEKTSGLKVTSTPTFIIVNNQQMIKGDEGIEPFEKAIKSIEEQK